jgi:hypothetical protein
VFFQAVRALRDFVATVRENAHGFEAMDALESWGKRTSAPTLMEVARVAANRQLPDCARLDRGICFYPCISK